LRIPSVRRNKEPEVAQCESAWQIVSDPAEALSRLDEAGDAVLWLDSNDALPPWEVVDDVFAELCEDWEWEEKPEPWSDPLPGWLDPADDREFARLQRSYAAVVQSLDGEIGSWLQELKGHAWWPETLLVFTTGYGQNLGEHGLIGDFRPWLHEELIHLPLVLRLPNDAQAGRRVFGLTQAVDVAATILDIFGIARPEEWHGSSLLPLCRGEPAIRSFACMGLKIGQSLEYALRTEDAAIILPQQDCPDLPLRAPMFFVKPDDRWEVNDLRQSNLERAEELEKTLRDYIATCGTPGER
jgi:hypothetical protein